MTGDHVRLGRYFVAYGYRHEIIPRDNVADWNGDIDGRKLEVAAVCSSEPYARAALEGIARDREVGQPPDDPVPQWWVLAVRNIEGFDVKIVAWRDRRRFRPQMQQHPRRDRQPAQSGRENAS